MQNLYKRTKLIIIDCGLKFSKTCMFTSELKTFVAYCVFGKTWLYIVLHDFSLSYYSSIILDSFSILLFLNYAGILASPLLTSQLHDTTSLRFHCKHALLSGVLYHCMQSSYTVRYQRSFIQIYTTSSRINCHLFSFIPTATKLLNSLPSHILEINSLKVFRKQFAILMNIN